MTGNNELNADAASSVVQAGQVNGDIVFNAVAGSPGRVSIAPPLDRRAVPFCGREGVVARLAAIVARGDGSMAVVHGPGGCGKTSAVLEVVAPRSQVWWVDAGSAKGLEAGLREVAFAAGADRCQVDQTWSGDGSAVELLKRALSAAGESWVLVIDNADDHRLLDEWRPALEQRTGTVLVTTRDGARKNWRAELVGLGVLDEDSAVELLLALAPDAGSDVEAAALARALGYLPLPLRLAGRYLGAAPTFPPLGTAVLPRGFGHYRETFQRRFADLDRLHDIGSGLGERELLSRTWELSLDLLAEHGLPRARPLLRWLACFGQAPIPCVLIEHTLLAQSPVFAGITEMDLINTVLALCDFGLVGHRVVVEHGVRVECLVLHPVIREANRHQADVPSHLQDYLRLCIGVLAGCTFNVPSNPAELALRGALSPHCADVVDAIHDARSSLANPEDWELMGTKFACAAGRHARSVKAYGLAHTMFQHALLIRLRYLGAGHPDVLQVRQEIAGLGWDRDRTRASYEEYANLVDDCRENLGESDPLTLMCRLELALVRDGLGGEVDDEYRAVASLSECPVVGLCAQLSLVEALWRRGDDVVAEQFKLLSMLRDAGDRLGEVPELWAGIGQQLSTYFGWCEFMDLWNWRDQAG